MEFRTRIEIPQNIPHIGHQDKLLLMGSCFAESIGRLLLDNKFQCQVNPFGILYNPFSVEKAIKQIITGKVYDKEDLFQHREQYHSYMHHGSFSDTDANQCLEKINNSLNNAHTLLPQLNFLLITFGTSWIYTLKENGQVVSNCHKVPAREFIRRRLSVQEITDSYKALINRLLTTNKNLRIVFTVSPIRHAKDGLHQNQLSKATLLLAIEELQTAFPQHVFYFPSYEILMDELRDYRFYANDMFHPSEVAIQYIWECFSDSLFSKETKKVLKECESIRRDINHKPFHADSDEYKHFLEQLVLKIYRLNEIYPNLELKNELNICLTRLKK